MVHRSESCRRPNSTIEVQLNRGDRLLLYSDGVTECANPAGDLFGDQRLRDYLTRAGANPLNDMLGRLETELETWRDKQEFDDDISLLALEVAEAAI